MFSLLIPFKVPSRYPILHPFPSVSNAQPLAPPLHFTAQVDTPPTVFLHSPVDPEEVHNNPVVVVDG